MSSKMTGPAAGVGLAVVLSLALTVGQPAQAHHLIEVLDLSVTPLNGLLSGLAHPVIGPDHLIFLLALALVGLRARTRWMIAMLALGLIGTLLGLVLPGLPAQELLLALSLGVEALVVLGRWPAMVLLPAMVLHGYGLSVPVLGWTSMPLTTYLLGLLLSQGLLLLLALAVLQRAAVTLSTRWRRLWVGMLLAVSAAGALAALVA
jgi:urease accessory protein